MLMRKLLFVIFTVWPGFVLLAQIEPVQNNPEEIKKLGVKMVSVYYYESVDTVGKEPKLALKKEFDAEGKILKKFTTSFWDVVSYSNSTTFKYDKRQQLVEETKLQTILVLENKDQEYIDSFGDAPLNEKIQYTYNSYGELIKKEIFIFRTNELSASTEPSQKITYEYESGLLRWT
jgi:hypothetical protein